MDLHKIEMNRNDSKPLSGATKTPQIEYEFTCISLASADAACGMLLIFGFRFPTNVLILLKSVVR